METQVKTYKNKWGYYPCDHTTYKKIKEINKLATKSLSMKSDWHRWARKAPHNRVLRKKIKINGDVVGSEVVGMRPEPEFIDAFLEKKKSLTHYPKHGGYSSKAVEEESLEFTNLLHLIQEDYKNARYPKTDNENIRPLKLSLEYIDSLVKDLKIQLA